MKFFLKTPRNAQTPATTVRCACGHDSPLEFSLDIGGTVREYRWRLDPRGSKIPIACASCLNRGFKNVEIIDDKVVPASFTRRLRVA